MAFAVGTVLQHAEASAVGAETTAGPGHGMVSLLRRLVRRPRWLVGQVATVAATMLQLGALSVAPVALVQPVLASGLAVALVIVAVQGRRPPTVVAVTGLLLTVVGLGVFLAAASPRQARHPPLPGLSAAVGLVVAMVVAVAVGRVARRGPGGSLLAGAAAGVCLAVAAVAAGAALDDLGQVGLGRAFLHWPPYVAVVAAVASEGLSQLAFARGELAWSLPALSVVDPVLAALLGSVLLNERLRVGSTPVWGAAAALACVGVVLCARSEAAVAG